MRIYYLDPALRHIQVDRERLVAFLLSQGVSDQDIKRLCIRFCDQVPQGYSTETPAEKILGSYNNSCSVYVCTKGRENKPKELNRTLMHELRHYMKRGYQPGETEISYWDRPSEVDARAFAEQYSTTEVLLHLVGVPDEPIPAPVVSSRPSTVVFVVAAILLFLQAWWKGAAS